MLWWLFKYATALPVFQSNAHIFHAHICIRAHVVKARVIMPQPISMPLKASNKCTKRAGNSSKNPTTCKKVLSARVRRVFDRKYPVLRLVLPS